jgi:hypothetical protein
MSVISRIFTKLIGGFKYKWKYKSALLRVNDIDISEPLSITFSSLRTRTLTDASYSTSGTFTITGGSYALLQSITINRNSNSSYNNKWVTKMQIEHRQVHHNQHK